MKLKIRVDFNQAPPAHRLLPTIHFNCLLPAAYCLFISLGLLFGCSKSSTTISTYYGEQHRPQFHFSPEKGWMNDPNGLVYYGGTYHLFYQHYPDSTIWGPMHWGHAVSSDLVHWKHMPIALYPDSLGYIFSGSAVVDKDNTSGFQQGNEKTLVAIYTYHDMKKEKAGGIDRESQGIAYSNDKGNSWIKYSGNPVLKNKGEQDFRDPKVFWHEATRRWIMPLAVGDHLEIFSSANLKDWAPESEFGKNEGSHGGVWECPDLFPLKTKDGMEKWILVQNISRGSVNGGSGVQYFIGQFDGKKFINDNKPSLILWLDYGADNYAGVTWFGTPDNRRIFIGWMSNWDDYATTVPASTWRSATTIARQLSLIETSEGTRVAQRPIAELEQLRKIKIEISPRLIADSLKIESPFVQKELLLDFDLSHSTAKQIGFVISNPAHEKVVIGYDKIAGEFFIDRTNSGKTAFSRKFAKKHVAPLKADGVLSMRVFIDATSIEVFVEDGKLAMTDLFFPNEDYKRLTLFSSEGKTELLRAEVFELKSIWKDKKSGN
jgi:fructan beta-fructosidase